MNKQKTSTAPVPSDLMFGPGASTSWRSDGRRTSLVRHAPRPRPVQLDAAGDAIEFDLARSALVVIDMQNDFCHPKGWFGQRGVRLAPMRKPIPVLQQLLPAWRGAGAPVIWLNWGIRADRLNLPASILFKGKRTAEAVGYADRSPEDRGQSLVRGHWGAQVVDELAVLDTDITVHKHRLSGFWDNELDSLLRGLDVRTLFFAGVNTDRCVFSSLQDAGFLGYDCILLADACSTPSPAYVTRAIHMLVRQLHGFVAQSFDLIAALPSPSSSPSRKGKR
ncbi:MAG: cysteine hydrolase [Betaproteobacteria bacterium]|nr:cysteine hydrolase [Betaproteobacteria bacterium]